MAYAAAEASPFNAICGKLADDVLSPQFVRSRFPEFSRQLHADMIAALRLLDREGLFGTGDDRAAITLFGRSATTTRPRRWKTNRRRR